MDPSLKPRCSAVPMTMVVNGPGAAPANAPRTVARMMVSVMASAEHRSLTGGSTMEPEPGGPRPFGNPPYHR